MRLVLQRSWHGSTNPEILRGSESCFPHEPRYVMTLFWLILFKGDLADAFCKGGSPVSEPCEEVQIPNWNHMKSSRRIWVVSTDTARNLKELPDLEVIKPFLTAAVLRARRAASAATNCAGSGSIWSSRCHVGHGPFVRDSRSEKEKQRISQEELQN